MGGEWKNVNFESLYSESSRNGLTKPKKVRGEGVKFINMGEIFAHDRLLNVEADFAPLSEQELERSLLKSGDLLFARQSLVLAGAGKCSIFVGDEGPVSFESHLIRVRLDLNKAVPEFYYYFFRSPPGKGSIYSIVEQGAGASGIRGTDLAGIQVIRPPLSEQRAIAHILGSLDDKIELNRQMNRTLEQMAQALFKSWFIDFDPVVYNAVKAGNPIPPRLQQTADRYRQNPQALNLPHDTLDLFPDTFEDSELGEIPKGWKVKAMSALIKLTGGGTPKTNIPEYWNGDIPWFSVVDAPNQSDLWVIATEKHVTQKGVDNSSTRILPKGATIISARGTVGKCALVGRSMAMNQSCYGVFPQSGYGELFINYMLRNKIEFLQQSGHGSVFNTITRSTFDAIKVVDSGEKVSQLFDTSVIDLVDKILQNLQESSILAQTRNTLLPKLISGELRVERLHDQVSKNNYIAGEQI